MLPSQAPRTVMDVRVFVGLLAFLALAGCGGRSRSVLESGVSFDAGHVHRIGRAEAIRDARSAHEEWLGMLRARARAAPLRAFPSPPRTVLMARLESLATKLHFRIRSVTMQRPLQLAPDVVIASDDYVRLARDVPQIVDTIDPPPRTNDRVYEGIFLECVDSSGVPFALTFSAVRTHVVGGQWARADVLFPYAHG